VQWLKSVLIDGWTSEPESVINQCWRNAVSVYYETAEVERCAVVKANFNANCNVYSDVSDVSDAKTLENNSNQCSAMFNQIWCSF